MAELDLRWLTAICLFLIGAAVIAWAIRIYYSSPIHRADIFGPYLTENGLRGLLASLPAFFVLGAFLMLTGVSKFLYWSRWHGLTRTDTANAVGVLEALFSVWAAGSVLYVTVRAWLRK